MPYYKEVEKRFNYFFETIVNKYSPFNDAKREVLKEEINVLNVIISKLDNKFASTLHRSLSNYAEHVKKADKRILDTFIFPIPIKGLTD